LTDVHAAGTRLADLSEFALVCSACQNLDGPAQYSLEERFFVTEGASFKIDMAAARRYLETCMPKRRSKESVAPRDPATELAVRHIEYAQESGARHLNLPALALSALPEAIGELSQLRALDLSDNPAQIWQKLEGIRKGWRLE
jgi:hypothetical protein